MFPTLQQWMVKQYYQVAKHGYIENLIGRRRRLRVLQLPEIQQLFQPHRDGTVTFNQHKFYKVLKNLGSGYQEKAAEARRQAINSPIQAAASDLTLLSCIKLSHFCEQYGLKSRPVLMVHDSIVADCPKNEVKLMAYTIQHYMTTIHKEYNLPFHVPLIADVEVGSDWSEKQSITDWLKENDA
jgi:DNA polymerase I-like protein with 3'-5' exonuclease and polymerase domains